MDEHRDHVIYKESGAFPLSFYLALGGAAFLAFSHWYAYSLGGEHRENELIAEAQEARKDEAKKANDASANLEKGNAKARVVYRTITRTVDRIVDRPIYRNVCFDDDGLREINAALAGTSTGKPDGAVSGSDKAGGWFRGLRPPKVD